MLEVYDSGKDRLAVQLIENETERYKSYCNL